MSTVPSTSFADTGGEAEGGSRDTPDTRGGRTEGEAEGEEGDDDDEEEEEEEEDDDDDEVGG
jgi:hypothetical protein